VDITQFLGPNVAPAFVKASADWQRGHDAYPHFDLAEQYNEQWIAGYTFAYHEHMDARERFEAQRGGDACDAWKRVRDSDLEAS
jgi:hypothetical protein